MADMQSALVQRLLADTAVAAIADDRLHWVDVPQGTALPYVRLIVISDPRPEHLKGYTGNRQTRVQADCCAGTYAAAVALAGTVIAAVAGPALVGDVQFGRTKAEGPRDLGEDTAAGFVHRASVDLIVDHRPAG